MTVTDWIQGIASVVAAGVAVVAVLIAWKALDAAEEQAQIADRALDAARVAATAQQRDARVGGVRPLAVFEPGRPERADAGVNAGQWIVRVLWPDQEDLVLDLRVILHGYLEDGQEWAAIASPGSFAPGARRGVDLVVTPMLRPGDGAVRLPNGSDPHLLELHRYGPLGQWIVEEYDWDMGARALDKEPRVFRLRRFHIDHKVPGGEPYDNRFE